MTGASNDKLSAYKELEKENRLLRAETDRLRYITQHITEVFWLRSADNRRMLYISPSYEKVWQQSSESLLAMLSDRFISAKSVNTNQGI